ncbi:hypothetical protein [Jannaschia sp. R86511]|uniref:hypothetical protein n=1 Tax=Jannaschia sp. R86511 TaxID=3093853 RepID=UPI0036D247A4
MDATIGSLLTVVLAASFLLLTGSPASAAQPVPRPPKTFTTAPESPSPYLGQVSCDPVEKPGATAMRSLLKATYGKANSGGTARSCSVGGRSEHKEGRAYDWALNAYNSADKAKGDAFVNWASGKDAKGVAGGNAHRLGIQYLIWNKRIWNAGSGWKAYTGASPHTDHVHISLSWDGAFKRTSWWTGKAVTKRDYGPCPMFVGDPAPKYTSPTYTPCRPVERPDGVVTGDFDGDGKSDLGIYSDGRFTIRVNGRVSSFAFGQAGDRPVAGDWDGDGVDGIGVFRAGRFYLRQTATAGGTQRAVGWGASGDRPVAGDWDGDGVDGVGVYRRGTWYLRAHTTAGSSNQKIVWGRSTDLPTSGDWDGDGRDSVGLLRGRTWYLKSMTKPGSSGTLTFGHPSGTPAVGDWYADGRTTLGTVWGREFWWTNDPQARDTKKSLAPPY